MSQKTESEEQKPVSTSPDEISIPDYPILLKHMVLAIFVANRLPRHRPAFSKNKIPVKSSPNKDRTDQTKFNAAMDVALAQLKKYRMISEKSSRSQVTLTARGKRRDSFHHREPGARIKTARFDRIYKELIVEGKKRVRRPPSNIHPSDPGANEKIERFGPQPQNRPGKPKNRRLKPRRPSRPSLVPQGNPVKPKNTPLKAKKPTTAYARRAPRVTRAARARKARRR